MLGKGLGISERFDQCGSKSDDCFTMRDDDSKVFKQEQRPEMR